MNWESAAVAAHVYKTILEKGYGCDVELVPGGHGADHHLHDREGRTPDLAPEIWINSAREVVGRAVKEGRLKIAGEILKDGGEEGWWIPDYFLKKHPELTTLQAVLKRPDLFPDKEEPGKGRFLQLPVGLGLPNHQRQPVRGLRPQEGRFRVVRSGIRRRPLRGHRQGLRNARSRSSATTGRRPRSSASIRWSGSRA